MRTHTLLIPEEGHYRSVGAAGHVKSFIQEVPKVFKLLISHAPLLQCVIKFLRGFFQFLIVVSKGFLLLLNGLLGQFGKGLDLVLDLVNVFLEGVGLEKIVF